MRIYISQNSSFLGDVKRNWERDLSNIEKAIEKKADLIIFPELSITGYSLQDLVQDVALELKKMKIEEKLKELSKKISIITGYVEEESKGLFYNSALFFSEGEVIHKHKKVYLPNFGLFDEKKFFAGGKNFKTFNTKFGKFGLLICRDFFHISSSYVLFLGNVDYLVVISASPSRQIKEDPSFVSTESWELIGKVVSKFFTTYVMYVNRVGFEDGLGFSGGSYIYDPFGNLAWKAPYLEEHFEIKEINPLDLRRARVIATYRRDEMPEIIYFEVERLIKER
ncbi:MAG: nitrilase-related carbon-nitrogen hydrolase [Acidobacteriota bacterium]